jgi:molybdenum cofactor cytidylyltransferase
MPAIAIVPAAGKAERFGSPKLVADLKGEPLIDHTLLSLFDGGVARVVVVTGPGSDLSMSRRLKDSRVKVVVNPDPSRGMLSSIQVGLATTGGDPILFLPADMPFVMSATVAEIINACVRRQRLIIPVHQDRNGHPIAIPNALRRAVLVAPPTSTLKDALAPFRPMGDELAVGDPGILRDVDAKEDLRDVAGGL